MNEQKRKEIKKRLSAISRDLKALKRKLPPPYTNAVYSHTLSSGKVHTLTICPLCGDGIAPGDTCHHIILLESES